MVKRQCPECRYFFAAPFTSEDGKALPCPDCAAEGTRPTKQPRVNWLSKGTGADPALPDANSAQV